MRFRARLGALDHPSRPTASSDRCEVRASVGSCDPKACHEETTGVDGSETVPAETVPTVFEGFFNETRRAETPPGWTGRC